MKHSPLLPLAAEFGVSIEILESLGVRRVGNEWHSPERDAEGDIIGTARRLADGRKRFIKGGRRGLCLKWPLHPYAGSSWNQPIILTEGLPDVSVAISVGYDAVGRPGALLGDKFFVPLLRDRHIVIAAENDASGAGVKGAEWSAAKLYGVAASVRIWTPPSGIKDFRQYVAAMREVRHAA